MIMRKFFTILAAAASLMFAATSCDLSIEEDYTFSYEVAYELKDEDQVEALEAYFKTFFETHPTRSFHGEYSAAVEKSIEYFLQDTQDLDEDYIQSYLFYEEDALRLLLVITSKKVNTVTAFRTWFGQPVDG